MTSLRVLAVASEIYPIIKTGGLADVVGALPIALRAHGIETQTLVPGYPDVIKALPTAEVLLDLSLIHILRLPSSWSCLTVDRAFTMSPFDFFLPPLIILSVVFFAMVFPLTSLCIAPSSILHGFQPVRQ